MRVMNKITSILVVLVVTACALQPASPPPATATATFVPVAQTTPVPTADRPVQPVQAADDDVPVLPTAAETCTAPRERPHHTIRADIDYAAHTVDVQQTVIVPNHDTVALDSIVFDVWSSRYPGVFTLNTISSGGESGASYELSAPRLVVALPQALLPGCSTQIGLAFRLQVPAGGRGFSGHTGYFGWTDRQLNLGHWLPVIAHRAANDWITHDPTALGEQVVADLADWDVTLRFANAPGSLKIAAPGTLTQEADGVWHVTHDRSRDVALSFSDMFSVRVAQSSSGALVEVYTLGDTLLETARGRVSAADHSLDMAVRSLARFSELFGSYTRERLVVVEGDFPDGMEFSGLIFVGTRWYERWNGTPRSYLTIITIHEVAHQWWYANVGSDQALTPWLDEALATYSEYLFYEDQFPELRSWWWEFRVNSFVPVDDIAGGLVGQSVYQFTDLRSYINAVYLRGAQMLHRLRQGLGDEAFFVWLQSYARSGEGKVMTPDAFWGLLNPGQQQQTAATRRLYLGGQD
jgi:hypothetical protein